MATNSQRKFAQMLARHEECFAPLRAVAGEVLGNVLDAEEAVQEVLWRTLQLRDVTSAEVASAWAEVLVEDVLAVCNVRMGCVANDVGGDDEEEEGREGTRCGTMIQELTVRLGTGREVSDEEEDEDDEGPTAPAAELFDLTGAEQELGQERRRARLRRAWIERLCRTVDEEEILGTWMRMGPANDNGRGE